MVKIKVNLLWNKRNGGVWWLLYVLRGILKVVGIS